LAITSMKGTKMGVIFLKTWHFMYAPTVQAVRYDLFMRQHRRFRA